MDDPLDDLTGPPVGTTVAAQQLNIAPSTLRTWIREGRVRVERTAGKHSRISRIELQRVKALRELDPYKAPPRVDEETVGDLLFWLCAAHVRFAVLARRCAPRTSAWAVMCLLFFMVLAPLPDAWPQRVFEGLLWERAISVEVATIGLIAGTMIEALRFVAVALAALALPVVAIKAAMNAERFAHEEAQNRLHSFLQTPVTRIDSANEDPQEWVGFRLRQPM